MDTFTRLKDKGISAYEAGDYGVAATYLVEAAEVLVDLAGKSASPKLRDQRKQMANELLSLAEAARDRASGQRPGGGTRNRPVGNQRAGGTQRQRGDNNTDDDAPDADAWIVREKPSITFNDVAGLEDVKTDIRLRMIYPFQHPELADRYGIPRGGGILLYGPPGTGKTMIAKATAGELDATFYVISPAQIMSKWVGEAEQNIKALFDSAREQAPSVIFMDEVEALVPSRRGQENSGVMQRVIPQILQEIEGFDRKADRALLFLGATNEPWALDSAMLRPGRLDTKVYVPLPDPPARMKLLEIYFKNRPLADDVDFGDLCDRLAGYSGADIKAIAQRSASIPFLEGISGKEARPIERRDILQVITTTPPSVNPRDLAKFEDFDQLV